MKTSFFIAIALTGALGATAGAQSGVPDAQIVADVPPLITDRPDFTESPQTVPKGLIQIEAGATFERSGRDKTTTLGETLIRIGAGERAEIRDGVPAYNVQRGDGRADGFDDAFLGAKFVLIERENFPVALLVGATLPTGSRRVAPRDTNVEAVLASETALSETLGLAFNLGYGRPNQGDGRFSQFFGSASFGFALSERVGAFAEVYAFDLDERGGSSRQFVNGGFTYAAKPNLQFDIRAGLGLGNRVSGPDYFAGAGVTQRF